VKSGTHLQQASHPAGNDNSTACRGSNATEYLKKRALARSIAADDTNDILVTTQAETKVGDVVVATGVVRRDVNLGSGYVYKVLVENASIAK